MFDIIPLSEAGPSFRALLANGGAAVVIVGSEWRSLWCDRRVGAQLDISEVKESFPGGPPTTGKRLRSVEISNAAEWNTAVAEFVKDVPPDKEIMFNDPLP